ncbi:MAG: PKD domain protein [Methanomassiliicoccales archaeon PtaB.Bin215]|nr:MAG: PKD domain protein [Methanomassiliicoccales archaeon PtaB.Bin215]
MNGSSIQYYIVASDQDVTFTSAGSSDPEGDQMSYTWDFGDGNVVTTTEVTAAHSYSSSQQFTVILTVNDGSGITTSRSFMVKVDGVPPLAVAMQNLAVLSSTLNVDQNKVYVFSSDPSVDMLNETANGLIASYEWVWGDGNTTVVSMGEGQNVTHAWANAGVFQMFLNVTDVVDHTASKAVTVTVRDTVPPTVRFSVKLNGTVVTSAKENQSLVFDASASSEVNGIASYLWEFGDGTNSTDDAPVHSYAEINTFTVKLTLTDNAGNVANATYSLNIQSSPRPDLRVGYVTFDPTNFVEGEDGYVYVQVTNVGTATAEGICGELSADNLDGNEHLMTNVSVLLVNGTEDTELLIGETGQLRFEVNFETRGNYSLTVNVIADDEVASKMTDNYITKILTVEGATDDGDENDGYLMPFIIVSIIALVLFALLVLLVFRRKR